MTSCSSMDSCQDESGECGQTESRCKVVMSESSPGEGASNSVSVKSMSNCSERTP